MTEDELWDYLLGFFAWDGGTRSSGIYDPRARQQAAELVKAMSEVELRYFLTRRIREDFLSEDALKQGYGIEDAAEFWRWFETEL